MQIQRMFCKMDPSGNGYVDLPEFEAYLRKYQMSLGSQRSGYLFSVIHSMNAELKEGGSVPHGKKTFFFAPLGAQGVTMSVFLCTTSAQSFLSSLRTLFLSSSYFIRQMEPKILRLVCTAPAPPRRRQTGLPGR